MENSENFEVEKLLQDCEKELANIDDLKKRQEERDRIKNLWLKYSADDEVISSKEYQELMEAESKKNRLKVFTGIPGVDGIIDGFREGNLVVMSGATKQGKTSMAQTFTENFSRDEINSLWFTYEVPMIEFIEKFSTPPLFYIPKTLKGNTTTWIEKRIIEGIAKHDIKAVFIDHLHYIVDLNSMGRGGNVSLQVGATMRELKKIALKWGVIIFLIAHIRKLTTNNIPELDDLRDSSLIAQEADIVLMISRLKDENTKEFSNNAVLSVKAHRRTGKMGSVVMTYNNNKFTELIQSYDEYQTS